MMNGINAGDRQKSKVQPVHPAMGCSEYGKYFAKEVKSQLTGEGFEALLQSEREKIEVDEATENCSNIFIRWFFLEKSGKDMRQYNKDIADEFITQVLRKRLQATEVDIVLPDALILLIMTCTEGNPGQSLMILSDLLESIHKRIGKIPAGYVITSSDFSQAFSSGWPIMKIKSVNEQYSQKWQNQKRKSLSPCETDNTMDTAEWWRKFVE